MQFASLLRVELAACFVARLGGVWARSSLKIIVGRDLFRKPSMLVQQSMRALPL